MPFHFLSLHKTHGRKQYTPKPTMRYLATHCHICSYLLKHYDKPWQAVLKQQQTYKIEQQC